MRRRRGAEHMQVLRDADVAWRVHHGGGAATRRLQHTPCVTGDGSWQAAAATTAPTDHNAGCQPLQTPGAAQNLPFRLQDGALTRAAPRAAYPRPFSRFFALAVWAGGLLTTVIRPQPCGLVSLRMGITQYSEVSAEYASLYGNCVLLSSCLKWILWSLG